MKKPKPEISELYAKLEDFYYKGGSRQDARRELNLKEGQISSMSSRRGFVWSLHVEDRRLRQARHNAGDTLLSQPKERYGAELKKARRSPFPDKEECDQFGIDKKDAEYLERMLYRQ